jgi:hypothetical protein
MMTRHAGYLPTQSALEPAGPCTDRGPGKLGELSGAVRRDRSKGACVANFGGRGQPADTPTAHQALADHHISARRAGRRRLIAEGGSAAQHATLLAALATGA